MMMSAGRIRSDDDDDEHHGRVIDNHYSPVQPELYVRFRVARAMAFYKGRIPRCHYVRNIAQTLLVLGSIGSAVLAYLDIASWAAVVSVVSGAITAYIEFQGKPCGLAHLHLLARVRQTLEGVLVLSVFASCDSQSRCLETSP